MFYGRLANPASTIGTDPRSDPRMVKALAPFGLDGRAPSPEIGVDAPLSERLALVATTERGLGAVFDTLGEAIPVVDGVTTTSTTISGSDGNVVTLYISRPDGRGDALPGVVHIHGGAMAMCSATDISYCRVREYLAGTGVVVIGVEFRNSGGRLGPHPYPAGLNDCAAAIRWAAESKTDLGITHIVVSGESGGGNLSLAVVHKAKREGWLHEIAGVYAQCPAISNAYVEQPANLPSLKENDEYFISCRLAALFMSVYDPDGLHAFDPACFAATAIDEDLIALPPHVISVNELDPARDEGLAYYRRLVRAGVPAIGRMVAGTCHSGDILLAGALPEVFDATMRDVSGFAWRCSRYHRCEPIPAQPISPGDGQ
ncbi:alpha/beta hydrolase fold domain-containing protein [Mycobacterium sp. DBP42]|jgi:acetyl esterase|uniref:alpha/beta hydrolase fold domain-containing protein n=1 Tax=Mycobacterium sp. DBP42 TaxID=2545267 RepID=UPI00110CB911|nr:alpha/beta hydrolase fold domain-containing protein [Mycobacterium sp. DBP42]TMS52451.1 alpha/beta hydrolase [Mycobacterium sp. DBP42]